MRMSCNGCRVLRKGCSDDCSIRPCLEWIKKSDSQANATVFLAKFYGRAGLMNLINAAPPHLRPAVFRSLLYEACGRIVNPIHGSVGLMWSGSWHLCHNAVEAVLRGTPITQMATDAAETRNGPPFKAYDIRHVNNLSGSTGLNRVRNRCRFKRSGAKSKQARVSLASAEEFDREEVTGSPSHESSLSHQSAATAAEPNVDPRERFDVAGNATADHEAKPGLDSVRDGGDEEQRQDDEGEMELELRLGLEPLSRCRKTRDTAPKRGVRFAQEVGFCRVELRLDCSAS